MECQCSVLLLPHKLAEPAAATTELSELLFSQRPVLPLYQAETNVESPVRRAPVSQLPDQTLPQLPKITHPKDGYSLWLSFPQGQGGVGLLSERKNAALWKARSVYSRTQLILRVPEKVQEFDHHPSTSVLRLNFCTAPPLLRCSINQSGVTQGPLPPPPNLQSVPRNHFNLGPIALEFRAHGADGILAAVLNWCHQSSAKSRRSTILTIHKKAHMSFLNGYRGISVMSVCVKLLN